MNVWLALAYDRHIHYRAAQRWFEHVESGSAFFCRFTQMGLLRLLTNARVMAADVMSQAASWKVYDALASDYRVSFAVEPVGMEAAFRRLTQSRYPATGNWSDAYLAAFAGTRDLSLVSFDRGFLNIKEVDAVILPPGASN